MKIEYQEGGSESRLVITSGFLWWRKHIHLVDEFCCVRRNCGR